MSDWKNVQYKDGKMRTSEGGGGGGSSTFAGLDDVSFNNLQNGQIPKYNSTTHKWENANESGGGTVTDVQVDGASVVNPQGVAEIETPDASGIEYDNQQSGLSATDVQSALDELAQGGGGVEDVEVNGTSVVNAQNVAEIKSYKEVTQAEYQALPSSKLTDNILYCIKDSAGADGFPPLVYSDEEREVGVWRDGKPLYQKTLHFNASILVNTSGWAPLDSTINGETLVSLNISALDKSYNESRAVTIRHDNANIVPRFQISEGAFQYYTNSQNFPFSGNNYDWDITIQYTKTTDTAGSGTWTTQGGYAHHYSTTEQVVGTWIDGKPLYEKTFVLQNSQTIAKNTWASVNIDLTNVKAIIDKRFINSSDGANTGGGSIVLKSNNQLLVGNEQGYNTMTFDTIILQYTKTTD